MKNEGVTLGLAGLSPHEQATVRLVQECLADRLHTTWRLTDATDADVVLADPRSESGRAILASSPANRRIIALLDRQADAPREHMDCVHRPLGPAALVRALNAAQDEGTHSSETATAPEEALPLSDIVRRAFRNRHDGTVYVVTGLAATPLVIDTGRDRIRGPLDAVGAACLQSRTACSFRTVHPVEAADIATGAPETMLHKWAWHAAHELDASLFGDADSTAVRLRRWPRLSSLSLPRKLFRVITLAHAHPHTLSELVEQTRLPKDSVRTMLDALWLTGELEVSDRPARTTPPASDRTARSEMHSLLKRLRNRLETA